MLGLPMSVCAMSSGAFIIGEAIVSIFYVHNGNTNLAIAGRVARIVVGALMIAGGTTL